MPTVDRDPRIKNRLVDHLLLLGQRPWTRVGWGLGPVARV